MGSLRARNYADSKLNLLDIGSDDAEDQPSLDELYEICSNTCEIDALFPELIADDDLIDDGARSGGGDQCNREG